jgi:hypothetical protein
MPTLEDFVLQHFQQLGDHLLGNLAAFREQCRIVGEGGQ